MPWEVNGHSHQTTGDSVGHPVKAMEILLSVQDLVAAYSLLTDASTQALHNRSIRKQQHDQKVNGLLIHCQVPEGIHRHRTV